MGYKAFKLLMFENDMRKADVIRATGVTRPTLLRWEKGGTPSLRTLKTIADYFGVSVDVFLEGEK